MYVITGVSGYVASRAAELLLKEVPADQVVVTSRDPGVLRQWADRGVTARRADYRDLDLTTEAFRGGTRLLMISAMDVGPERRRQHSNAVAAARAAGVQYVVYTSFIGADDPTNDALVTQDHRHTEQEILASGLQYNFARNSQYADAMAVEHATISIQSGRSVSNSGDGGIGFVARDDVAAVLVALLLGKGEPNRGYDVTGPELLTMREVAELESALSGVPLEIVDLSDDEMYAMWDSIGVPRQATDDFTDSPVPWCSDDMVSFGRVIREGRLAVLTDTVEELTGARPVRLRDLMEAASQNWPRR
jgi:NAD(P)H dehydrogenase (quinone)